MDYGLKTATVLYLNSLKHKNISFTSRKRGSKSCWFAFHWSLLSRSLRKSLVLSVKISPRAGLICSSESYDAFFEMRLSKELSRRYFCLSSYFWEKVCRDGISRNFIATIVKHQSVELNLVHALIFLGLYFFPDPRNILRFSLIFHVQWNLFNSVVVDCWKQICYMTQYWLNILNSLRYQINEPLQIWNLKYLRLEIYHIHLFEIIISIITIF